MKNYAWSHEWHDHIKPTVPNCRMFHTNSKYFYTIRMIMDDDFISPFLKKLSTEYTPKAEPFDEVNSAN